MGGGLGSILGRKATLTTGVAALYLRYALGADRFLSFAVKAACFAFGGALWSNAYSRHRRRFDRERVKDNIRYAIYVISSNNSLLWGSTMAGGALALSVGCLPLGWWLKSVVGAAVSTVVVKTANSHYRGLGKWVHLSKQEDPPVVLVNFGCTVS